MPVSYLSFESLKKYIRVIVPLTATQIAASIGLFAAMVMVGQVGGPHSIAVLGLTDFWIFILFQPITQTINDVGGIYFSLFFAAHRFDQVINYKWKVLFLLAVCFIAISFLSYFSKEILIFIGADPVVAIPSSKLIFYSMGYLPFANLSHFIQTFLSSQNALKYFNRISFLSTILTIILCYYFIVKCDMKEFGFVPAKIIQEGIIFLLYAFLFYSQSNKDCLGWLKTDLLFKDYLPFLIRIVKSVTSVMCEYLGFEFNTYLAALLHNINDFAIWEAWANVENVIFFVSFAVASTFRLEIGSLIGRNNMKLARERSIAYFFYTYCFALILSISYWLFAEDISRLFFKEEILINRLVYCINVYLIFLYFYLVFYPVFTIFRLLKLDNYLFFMIALLFPTIIIVVNVGLAFYFKLGLIGLVYGHIFCTTSVCCMCIYKIFWLYDWNLVLQKADHLTNDEILMLLPIK